MKKTMKLVSLCTALVLSAGMTACTKSTATDAPQTTIAQTAEIDRNGTTLIEAPRFTLELSNKNFNGYTENHKPENNGAAFNYLISDDTEATFYIFGSDKYNSPEEFCDEWAKVYKTELNEAECKEIQKSAVEINGKEYYCFEMTLIYKKTDPGDSFSDLGSIITCSPMKIYAFSENDIVYATVLYKVESYYENKTDFNASLFTEEDNAALADVAGSLITRSE